tara:strand:+ start:335 stop:1654 length:1320 start_codon:yes stop_codon:yes gene_type:complete
VGTRKISQLDTIADANLSGEAILPLVVSDPLIPNRKAKVNQLFKGVAQGVKDAPGLCFDLDRDTGLYQDAYDQIGIGFGDGGFYYTRIQDSASISSLYISAVDETIANANIVLSPKGTGSVRVAGQFTISDTAFILEDAQGPKARFEIGAISNDATVKIFNLPTIATGNDTVLVGDNTIQTLRSKTIIIDEDNLVLVDGEEEAVFQINWPTSVGLRRQYFLPDPGPVTTTVEPTATSSTLVDTKAEQTLLTKTLVNGKLAADAEVDTPWAQFNTDALTTNRTVTIPDLSITLVGLDATQVITNKTYKDPIFADSTDVTKKIVWSLANLGTSTSSVYEFPETDTLNNGLNNNVLVTELATQDITNKTLVSPQIKVAGSTTTVTIDASNITNNRTIRFPDADATLLSTSNVTLEDVTFGAGIGAATLTGRTRQQQFFYAGF